MNDHDLIAAIQKLQAQLDEVLSIVRSLEGKRQARVAAKRAKKTETQLTEAEIASFKQNFAELYDRWLAGEEARIQAELEAMDAGQLRLIADANNLNVTSKTPKAKCILLIGTRFREKKQLTAGLATQVNRESRSTQPETGGDA